MGLADVYDFAGDFNTLWSAKSHAESAADGNGNAVTNTLSLGSDAIGIASMAPKCPETPVIQAGLLALAAMNLTCGIGTPDSGDRFGNGNKEFSTVGQILKSATPTQNWQGSASTAYAAQDVKQQDRSQLMAKADSIIESVVKKQAGQVANTRSLLDACSVALGIMVAPAVAAYAIPVVGPELSMAIQIGAVAGSLPIAQTRMMKMTTDAAMNGIEVAKAARMYNQVSATAG